MTAHSGNQNMGFTIIEDVAFDHAAGPWEKHLSNSGPGIDSGEPVPIVEHITNTGTQAWTDWHEEIIGPVEDFGFGPATDFAFERESVSVSRNGIGLVEGVDYTLTFTEHPIFQPNQPGDVVDPGRHWQSIDIFFNEASFIQPSDTLTIEKNIFETFLNGTPWNFMLVAQIAQYPTIPEPGTAVLVAICAAFPFMRRAR
jgi:hypothetical protein